MKKSFLAIATILLLTQVVSSQVLDGIYIKPDEERIIDIDKMRQEIKANLKSFTKSERVKDSSSYRYVYTKGKELQLITVYYKDTNNIDKNVSWYFHNGQLIYSEKTWTDRTTKKVVENEKAYLDYENLFAWFINDKKVDVTSQEFKKMAVEFPAYAAKLKADSKSLH
jgi:hypothetical protein